MRIAYDPVLKRPGCVLLQAALAEEQAVTFVGQHFDSRLWIVAPTPNLSVFSVTDDEAALLIIITKMEADYPLSDDEIAFARQMVEKNHDAR